MSQTSAPSRTQRFFSFLFGCLLRLLLLAVLLGGLAALVLYGLPYLYRTYLQPLEETRARVAQLEHMHQRMQQEFAQDISQIQGILKDLSTRQQKLLQKIQALDESLAQVQDRLEEVDGVSVEIAHIKTALNGLKTDLAAQQKQWNTLVEQINTLQADLDHLEGRVAQPPTYLAALQRQQMFLLWNVYVLRAQLLIQQGNLRDAEKTITEALTLWQELQAQAPKIQQRAYREVGRRLESAADYLPGAPRIAAKDLEAAWVLAQRLKPKISLQATPTPVETPTPEATP